MAPKKKKGEGKKAGRRKEKGFKGPGKILAYHDEEYWNSRYANQPEPFDWYQSYKELKGLFEMYLPKDNKILNAGCGNGRFRQDMKDLKMFKDFSMDHVIDKGFLDSILCAADALNQVALVFGEIRRVLKVGGLYILITYGDPRTRMPWLKTPLTPWKSIIVHVFPRPGSPKALNPGPRPILEPVYMLPDLTLGPQFNLDDPDWHYIYVCKKETEDLTKAPQPRKKKPLKA
ncbi:uncharacterized protein [Physcomitrium patens]|uniref:uncharacterized protein isoform X3 n=1 Tax=Physcomitrium patens TaxID=3218 RepID=UPI000D177498|nr:EEF1A lysine methyltransferase 4-like isoform X3 [Physcomitrium patens]|eukprot:XP_024379686.1 EEF1A lysine methyltransferase 4-like isoform X3 [Physcomitrella patens]